MIDKQYIEELLAKQYASQEIDAALDKAQQFKGLTHTEVAALLSAVEPRHVERIYAIASHIKQHIYGSRVVLFAPIYISDHCVNNCRYCGFRKDNTHKRRKLTQQEIREQALILLKMGHKRLALEAGEDDAKCPIEYIVESIKTLYNTKQEDGPKGEIRRINVNIAATTVDNYRLLKQADIGTYILFQETYHRPTYEYNHISGPKSNYDYHLTAFDRAMTAGIDDVGAGVLLGLYDPRFEVMGLMLHNEHLEKKFGVGFHTISVPRIRAAVGAEQPDSAYAVSDEDFLKLVSIIRIAVPFTGIIISTRESAQMRKRLINMGVSQLSAGSSVDVGGYTDGQDACAFTPQFDVSDHRPAGHVISWIMDEGYIPSFCTACYRKGRTGDRFMQLAKTGNIKNVCLPNALLTLWEYAMDYGDSQFRKKAEALIQQQIDQIENEKVLEQVKVSLDKITEGGRDYFL